MSQIDALKCLLLIDSPPKNNWRPISSRSYVTQWVTQCQQKTKQKIENPKSQMDANNSVENNRVE